MANLKKSVIELLPFHLRCKLQAMKMVSAAKLKKQDAIKQCLICRKLTELLQNLSATLEGDAGEFTTA
jgi:F-type H+-transporting ATPase subunit gamma